MSNLAMEWVLLSVLSRLAQAVLFLLFFAAVYFLMKALFHRHRRKYIHPGGVRSSERVPLILRKMLFIPPAAGKVLKERQQLLTGCGLHWGAGMYFAIKRMTLVILFTTGFGAAWAGNSYIEFRPASRLIVIVFIAAVLALLSDKPILESMMRRRRQRIVDEVYKISRQLLYFSGSSMNLHTRLVRCLPHARTIRNELYMLTNEWYHNAGVAIGRFKQRIGTEEGYSFAETINSLRQYESDRYYELLRQRVQDYKEKLELSKEGRRETVSYLLFVMAGVPILFTFRLFVYPWVAEGQKLFDLLN